MTDDEMEDLLGPEPEPEPEPKSKPGRKPGRKKSSRGAEEGSSRALGRVSHEVVQALHRPVSVTFLSQAMNIDRKTVVKRLTGLKPVAHHRGDVPLYDFREAMKFLVQGKVDVASYVRKMGVADLPTALQKDVWDARLKEQKWRQNAGELWPTEAVLGVLGETFSRLKTTTQLWIDQIAETHSLPAEVRSELLVRVDALQTDLHRTLVEMPKEKATENQTAEIGDNDGLTDG